MNAPIDTAYAEGLITEARKKFRAMDPNLFGGPSNPRIADTIGEKAPLGTVNVASGIDLSTTEGLMARVDLTLLDLTAQNEKVAAIARRAMEEGAATVCVYPRHVKIVQNITGGNPPPIAVVGFPFVADTGANMKKGDDLTPVEQTRWAIDDGAKEIDMVLPRSFKDGNPDYAAHYRYIREIVEAAAKEGMKKFGKPVPVKVILETAYLTDEQKVEASMLAKMAGATFVKTSTGFAEKELMQPGAPKGATEHDVALMRLAVGDTTLTDDGQVVEMGVKASGGVGNREQATGMYKAGATRIGASNINVRTPEEQAEWDKLHPPAKTVSGGY